MIVWGVGLVEIGIGVGLLRSDQWAFLVFPFVITTFTTFGIWAISRHGTCGCSLPMAGVHSIRWLLVRNGLITVIVIASNTEGTAELIARLAPAATVFAICVSVLLLGGMTRSRSLQTVSELAHLRKV